MAGRNQRLADGFTAKLVPCVLLLIHAYWCKNKNIEKVAKDLLLLEEQPSKRKTEATRRQAAVAQLIQKTTEVQQKPEQNGGKCREQPWIKFSSHFWYRMPGDNRGVLSNGKQLANDIHRFWQGYIYQGYLEARTYRVIVGLMTLIVLWLILYFMVGIPAPPVRGNVSWWAYYLVTIGLGLSALALIVFVADTTLLCWRVIGALHNDSARGTNSIWPSRSLQEYSGRQYSGSGHDGGGRTDRHRLRGSAAMVGGGIACQDVSTNQRAPCAGQKNQSTMGLPTNWRCCCAA
jgi:hypothetical protein